MAKSNENSRQGRGCKNPFVRWSAVFVLLLGLWLLLSGKFLVEFIVLGVISSALVVYLTSHLLKVPSTEEHESLPKGFLFLALAIGRFLIYLPWLAAEIVLANIQVAYQILHPKMPISPRLLIFRTTLESEPAQILLAQSITLTPGTITVDLDQGQFIVHALRADQSQILQDGGMQERVGKVFGELPEPTGPVRTAADIDELPS